jgi:tryptophan-rich sensory protein
MTAAVAARGGRWKPILVAAGAALAVAALGGAATDIGPWYLGLRKPSWQPPDWLFAPVWTAIFALTALAGLRAWRRTPDARGRGRVLAAYALNALLNILWSALFFTLKRPDWALVEVVPLWLSVVLLVVVSGRRDRAAGWLLAPYLAWVGFAAVLNWSVVRLNGPFPGP